MVGRCALIRRGDDALLHRVHCRDGRAHSISGIMLSMPVSNQRSHFKIATKCISEFDLARRLALHLEQSRAGDNQSHALSTRSWSFLVLRRLLVLSKGAHSAYELHRFRGSACSRPVYAPRSPPAGEVACLSAKLGQGRGLQGLRSSTSTRANGPS